MELKRFADRVVAAPLGLMWHKEGDTGLVASLTFDVVDGDLQCREVKVTARPGRPPVTRAFLRSIPIDDLREEAATFSAPYESSAGGTVVSFVIGDEANEREAVRQARAVRRKDDPETLRRVLEVVAENPKSPTKAVAAEFGIAHRTASLYIARARKAEEGTR